MAKDQPTTSTNKATMKELAIKSIKQQMLKPIEKTNKQERNIKGNFKENNYKPRRKEPEKTTDHAPPMSFYLANRPFESRLPTENEKTAICKGLDQIFYPIRNKK